MMSETQIEKIDLKWLVETYLIDTDDIDSFAEGCLSGVNSLLKEISPIDEGKKLYDLTGLAKSLMYNNQSFIITNNLNGLQKGIDKISVSESKSFPFYDVSSQYGAYNHILSYMCLSETLSNPQNKFPDDLIELMNRGLTSTFKKTIKGSRVDPKLYHSESDKYLQVLSNNYLALTNRNVGNNKATLALFKDSLSILDELGLDTIWSKIAHHNGVITEDEYNILKLGGDVKFNIAMSEKSSEEKQLNFNHSISIREFVLSANPSYIESTSAKIALLDSYSTLGNEIINNDGFSTMRDLNSIFNKAKRLSDDIILTDTIEPFLQSFKTFEKAYDL
ncbi:MAG: hypothetical protein KAI18_01330 [Candidatus Aenigmarchaeota archaeon]|nr:hypothetical protein [Candidatus Aenigmarchaeota archaeon]